MMDDIFRKYISKKDDVQYIAELLNISIEHLLLLQEWIDIKSGVFGAPIEYCQMFETISSLIPENLKPDFPKGRYYRTNIIQRERIIDLLTKGWYVNDYSTRTVESFTYGRYKNPQYINDYGIFRSHDKKTVEPLLNIDLLLGRLIWDNEPKRFIGTPELICRKPEKINSGQVKTIYFPNNDKELKELFENRCKKSKNITHVSLKTNN